jgi:hypothetical protein
MERKKGEMVEWELRPVSQVDLLIMQVVVAAAETRESGALVRLAVEMVVMPEMDWMLL